MLLTNVIQNNEKLSELLLIDLAHVYNNHPVFFISVAHYFFNLVRSPAIAQLAHCHHLKIQKNFIETISLLLHKVIKEAKPYYAIWVVEILSEIVMNDEASVSETQRQEYYE